jgi:hypothetical protein
MVRPGGVLQDQSGSPGRLFFSPVATSEPRARILLVGLFVFWAGIGVIGGGALRGSNPKFDSKMRSPRPYNGAIADSGTVSRGGPNGDAAIEDSRIASRKAVQDGRALYP